MNNYGEGAHRVGGQSNALPDCLNETAARISTGMESTCAQGMTVPRGWTNWQALRGNSVYYNYTLSNNGCIEKHSDDYATDYLTDLVKVCSPCHVNPSVRQS